jgi:hypothetical protein
MMTINFESGTESGNKGLRRMDDVIAAVAVAIAATVAGAVAVAIAATVDGAVAVAGAATVAGTVG